DREGQAGSESDDLDGESGGMSGSPGAADVTGDDDENDGLGALAARVRTDWREWLRMWAPWVALAVLVAAVSWFFVKPAPPRRVTIAAGPRDGAYYAFAQEYAKTFAASGVTLEVRETAGTVDNYRLLNDDPGVELAIVQGGA